MNKIVIITGIQLILFLFLLGKDKNNGVKELFKKQQWKNTDVIIVLFLMNSYPALFVVAYFLLLTISIDLYKISAEIELFATYIMLILIFLLLFKYKFKQRITVLGMARKDLLKHSGYSVAIAFACYIALNILFLLVWPDKYVAAGIHNVRDIHDHLDVFLFLFATVLLAPIIEEAFFRGILYSPYRKKYGRFGAAVFTAAFFAAAHLSIAMLVLGFFLAVLYEKTESIVSPIIAHGIYNLLVAITMLNIDKIGDKLGAAPI